MAQIPVFEPHGSMEVKKGVTYTTANLPTGMDFIILSKGVSQYSKLLDENGEPILKDNKSQYAKTVLRGVKVKVTHTTMSYVAGFPNVPFVWWEGDSLGFRTDCTYEFFDDGIVVYGVKAVV